MRRLLASMVAPLLALAVVVSCARRPPRRAATSNSGVTSVESACSFSEETVAHLRDVVVDVVTEESGEWLKEVRESIDLPRVHADSVLTITDTGTCNRARSAYRLRKFGADTGWISKVSVYRVRNRFAVYGGESSSAGLRVFIFDRRWKYKATY